MITAERAQQIVTAWRTDPLDTWRQSQKQSRFIAPAGPAYTHALANEVEGLVTGKLEALGYHVAKTSHKAPYDLIVNNCLHIELKASNWVPRRNHSGRYQCNLRPRQRRAADVLIFACRSTDWQWFIIPTSRIDSRTIHITTYNPATYRGRWSRYLGQWSIIAGMVPVVQDRTRQISLAEVLQ